jgi:KDO2-lipid IV(A) lauroyltransferase
VWHAKTATSPLLLCLMNFCGRRTESRFGAEMIERSTSARKIVRYLREGKPVMLAADMDHGIDNLFLCLFWRPCVHADVCFETREIGARARCAVRDGSIAGISKGIG